MPRQRLSYIVPQPIEPMNLEELKFWLRIMEEHACTIKAGLPCDAAELIDGAQTFYQELHALRIRADKVQSERKFIELVTDAHCKVRDFHRYKHYLLQLKITCRLGGYNFPLLLDHMAREAEYVMRLFDQIKEGVKGIKSRPREMVFWLRLMADHAKFIDHLLDPSERNLINTAADFSEEFDGLFMQDRDYATMLHCKKREVPAFRRFMKDTRVAVIRLRDFKRALRDMIAECCVLSLISEALADHVLREAEHFLLILAMLEKSGAVDCEEGQECLPDDGVGLPFTEEDECFDREPPASLKNAKFNLAAETEKIIKAGEKEVERETAAAGEAEPVSGDCGIAETTTDEDITAGDEEDAPAGEDEQGPPVTKTKHKWGAKWPRPLGGSGK